MTVLLMIVVVPVVVVVGTMFLIGHQAVRRTPFPSPVLPGIRCPFCGREMRHGRIAHGG